LTAAKATVCKSRISGEGDKVRFAADKKQNKTGKNKKKQEWFYSVLVGFMLFFISREAEKEQQDAPTILFLFVDG
jgi:hypothetical protein